MGVTVNPANSAVNSASSANSAQRNQDKKKGGKDLTIDDFFTLLAAQLSNQNMMNPVQDTEYISQMAQFAALSATQQLNSSFSGFQAVSYIGKNIKAQQTDSLGKVTTIEGTAQKVEFKSGKIYITVGDKKVAPNEIIEVTNQIKTEE
jgi:Flagellar hook capping protein